MNILVLDDAFPELIALWMRKIGYKPFIARTLKEAKQIITDEIIDVAIIDINLGTGGGLGTELIPELKKSKIHIIVMTAYYNIKHYVKDPGIMIFEKPIVFDQIKNFIEGIRMKDGK